MFIVNHLESFEKSLRVQKNEQVFDQDQKRSFFEPAKTKASADRSVRAPGQAISAKRSERSYFAKPSFKNF